MQDLFGNSHAYVNLAKNTTTTTTSRRLPFSNMGEYTCTTKANRAVLSCAISMCVYLSVLLPLLDDKDDDDSSTESVRSSACIFFFSSLLFLVLLLVVISLWLIRAHASPLLLVLPSTKLSLVMQERCFYFSSQFL